VVSELGQLWLTPKIDKRLEDLAREHGVYKEGLGNILLLLAMSSPCITKQAINIIKTWNIGGATDLEKMETRGT